MNFLRVTGGRTSSRVTSRHYGLQQRQPGVHIEVEPSERVDVFPYQRRQGGVVAQCQLALPVRLLQHPLNHQRVDVHHAVLDQVQREHADLMILAAVTCHLATPDEEHT